MPNPERGNAGIGMGVSMVINTSGLGMGYDGGMSGSRRSRQDQSLVYSSPPEDEGTAKLE
jgi:hypothetical protein